MKAIADPQGLLAQGLAQLREEHGLVAPLPADAVAEAHEAIRRPPWAHRDRTAWPFVTLDPAAATDLDQAFCLERSGADVLLHYAIADVGFFVTPEGAMERESWRRGMTQYLPDGRAPLYPPVLSEGAASLLPDGPRPAVVFTVAVDPAGEARLVDAERALVRSRAKLGYETVRPDQLPVLMAEFAARVRLAETARGAVRVDSPQQELRSLPDGRFALTLQPPTAAERDNAALSLATNLAIARLLLAHRTGVFREMDPPDLRELARLRVSAAVLGLHWLPGEDLATLQQRLDPARPADAEFLLEIRRAGGGASYRPYTAGHRPWHAAIAASYVHATAPLRRLGDRYVIEAALALARGTTPGPYVEFSFRALGPVLNAADELAGRLEHEVHDLAEAVMLSPEVGRRFEAVVLEPNHGRARIQLVGHPVIAQVEVPAGTRAGERVTVRLEKADPVRRRVAFALA